MKAIPPFAEPPAPGPAPSGLFTETAFVRKKHRQEMVARCLFGAMALAMILPLILIVSYLVIKAWPLLSWDFVTSNPTNGMRKGGIWSALLGTIYLVVCSLLIAFFARTFALKAQDRAIRAEENLRHFAMTGKLLDSRLETLQIVALRFAADAEFVDLAKKSAEQGTAPKDIKQAIKNWRPDLYRA